jgi:hypothetical protein
MWNSSGIAEADSQVESQRQIFSEKFDTGGKQD